jgi:hypothetical protein
LVVATNAPSAAGEPITPQLDNKITILLMTVDQKAGSSSAGKHLVVKHHGCQSWQKDDSHSILEFPDEGTAEDLVKA